MYVIVLTRDIVAICYVCVCVCVVCMCVCVTTCVKAERNEEQKIEKEKGRER